MLGCAREGGGMNPVNWTAILALLVAAGAVMCAWACNRSCESIVTNVSQTMQRENDEHDEEMGKLNADYANLLRQYEDAERRARRRELSHTTKPQSEVQHQERGNAPKRAFGPGNFAARSTPTGDTNG